VPEIPPPAAPANPAAEPLPAPDSLEGQVIELLKSGRKIEAIKLHRQRMGTDLMHAKQAVEAIGQRYGIAAASGGGCAGMVLLLVGLPALAGLARWLMVG